MLQDIWSIYKILLNSYKLATDDPKVKLMKHFMCNNIRNNKIIRKKFNKTSTKIIH